MATFKQFLEQDAKKRERARFPEHVSEAAARNIGQAEVDAARAEYLAKLEQLRKVSRSNSWTLSEPDRLELELFRLRFEALLDTSRAAQRDEEASENRDLARTNTQLAGTQMWMAVAVAAFTGLQVLLALLTLLKSR